MPTVVIRDERSPGTLEGEVRLEVFERRLTLRDLIRTRVREEVAKANLEPGRHVRMLVKPVDAVATLNGYRLGGPKRIDWRRQAEAAEEAFMRNGFLVIVGQRQVDDLDEELDLDIDTEIRFVRLVPLVGG
jgi:hypothetical protein